MYMVIVVEGKNDANKLKTIFKDADIIITNGSEINSFVINDIYNASLKNEVILCLDPDGPGEKIRKTIVEKVPNVQQVFARKSIAISKNKKKVGIEHMTKKDLLEMFENIKYSKNSGNITYMQMYELGYMTSKEKRIMLCEKLNISYSNGKQLIKRLNMFGITLEEIKKYDS